MEVWAEMYANLVKNKMKKMEDVPEELRPMVEELLK